VGELLGKTIGALVEALAGLGWLLGLQIALLLLILCLLVGVHEVAATATIKESGHLIPKWLMATAYTSLLAAGVLFGARVLRKRGSR